MLLVMLGILQLGRNEVNTAYN